MMSILDNILMVLHNMTSSRCMKNGVGFVSENLVPASESVEPNLVVQDLVHDGIHNVMDEHEDHNESTICISVPSVSSKEYLSHPGIVVFHTHVLCTCQCLTIFSWCCMF